MTEVVRRERILMGEAHLHLGNFDDARCAFQGVNYTQGLIACGAAALEAGWYHEGRLAYSAARMEMPKEKIVACGHAALQNGWLDEASSAFSDVGLDMPIDGLIVCGTKALEDGRPEAARRAFGIAAALELRQPTK